MAFPPTFTFSDTRHWSAATVNLLYTLLFLKTCIMSKYCLYMSGSRNCYSCIIFKRESLRDHGTSICSTFLAHPTTFMPCWTRDLAIAAPIPTEAPVTRATLPIQRSILQVTVSKPLQENSSLSFNSSH